MFIENPQFQVSSNFIFMSKSVLVKEDGSLPDAFEFTTLFPVEGGFVYGEDEYSWKATEAEIEYPEGFKYITLREYFSTHSEEENNIISRAYSLLKWRKNMNYCSICGNRLVDSEEFSARVCPECNELFFPRIEPCVIVLIQKEDYILLVRHTYRNQNIFACVAGFIEAGETAEQAVVREVMEETGLSIKNIQFKGTQSWPFPDQLMLAYTAEYASGEIEIQESEIAEAKWFKKDNLPDCIPKKGSVAFNLIYGLFDKD